MVSRTITASGDLGEGQAPSTAALDAAAEYIRARADKIVPLYVLAMAPHAVIMVHLIDAIIGEHRSTIPTYCLYLAGATVWRWVWLARLQYRVEQDLQERKGGPFWRRLAPILGLRVWSNFAVTWGSFLVIPGFYGLFVGSFAAPLLLGNTDPTLKRTVRAISWIRFSSRRLLRVLVIMTGITVLLLVAIFVGQSILANTILPSLVGVDTAELNVTLDSWAWRLRVFYFIFLLLDFFWTVASVYLFYESQSRRMASDLRARLTVMMGGAA